MSAAHPLAASAAVDVLLGGGTAADAVIAAQVAVADRSGMLVSSLMSVFDDFGSAIYLPESGFVLNNRAAGFTSPPNHPEPGKLPVHPLAPVLVEVGHIVFALATPGADGQIQTLLQILLDIAERDLDLATAMGRPRWRSEDGKLLLEDGHDDAATLTRLRHRVVPAPAGDTRFGGAVCVGISGDVPFAVSDWRRENWSSVV